MSRWTALTIVAVMLAGCLFGGSVAFAQNARGGDVDALMASAIRLRQLNRKAEALARVRRAATLAPTRADVEELRALLEQEVLGSEATVGLSYEGWDDGRAPRREQQLVYRRNTARGPVFARVARVERFGRNDAKVEVEAYPAFRGGYASLALGVASTGDLYPNSTIGAELFGMLAAQHEASIGYRRLAFSDAVNLFTGSLGTYFSDYLIGARVYRVTAGASGTAASLFLRKYLADDGHYVGAYATTGTIRDDIQAVTDFNVRSSSSAGIEALFIVKSRWLMTARQSLGRDNLRGGGSAVFYALDVGLGARF